MPRTLILLDTVPADAPADAQDVLAEAAAVEQALQGLGWSTGRLEVGLDLDAASRGIREREPDLVFNLVETLGGIARLAPFAAALFDHLGIPYTGATAESILTTTNKRLAKSLLLLAGLPTPPLLTAVGPTDPPERSWIVKSVWEHASIGIDDGSVTGDDGTARNTLLEHRARLGGEWFAERYVDGREFNLSLLEAGGAPEVLPPAEIRFVDYPPGKPRIVNYAAKWMPDAFEYRRTERIFPEAGADAPLFAELGRLASACWALFDLAGYARVDFRVDREGRPWIVDINSNPCLAPDAGFAAAVARSGATFDHAIARIVEGALRRSTLDAESAT